jgi:hypothetical protein
MRHTVSPPYATPHIEPRRASSPVHQPRLRKMTDGSRPALARSNVAKLSKISGLERSRAFVSQSDLDVVQRPGRAAGLTIALALVAIAVAALVGAAFTGWHYWNAERRAAVTEAMREQRGLELWKQAARNAEAKRQELQALTSAPQPLSAKKTWLAPLSADSELTLTFVSANKSVPRSN